jgi:hypothetical protein
MLVASLEFLDDYAPLSFDSAMDCCHDRRFARKTGVFGMGGELIVRTELWDVMINLVVVSRHATGKEFEGSIVDCRFVDVILLYLYCTKVDLPVAISLMPMLFVVDLVTVPPRRRWMIVAMDPSMCFPPARVKSAILWARRNILQ